MQENIYKRLAQAEAMAAAQKAETMEVLQAAYKRACEELNEEDAAAFAVSYRVVFRRLFPPPGVLVACASTVYLLYHVLPRL